MGCYILFYVAGGGAINGIQECMSIPDLTSVKSNSDMTIVSCCDPDVKGMTHDEIKAGFTVSAAGKLVAV